MKQDKDRKGDSKAEQHPTARSKSDSNHGEGNPEAAERFNEAEQAFIASPQGQRRIREAGNVRPDEEAELAEAERITRSPPIGTTSKTIPPKR
jgi:hypothetical protein